MSTGSLISLRPQPKRKLDQFGVTEKTLVARANFLAARGFLTDSKILFLGDYDLTSLACLPLAKNTEIWVLDIDPAVLELIKKESREAISTVEHDLTNPLPKRLISSFDVVFTDPSYTPEGVSLFLSRCLEALTASDEALTFLSYGSLDPVRVLNVQEKILKHGVIIEELRPKFNEYISAKTIGDVSDLYVLRPTDRVRPSVRGKYRGKIYTHE